MRRLINLRMALSLMVAVGLTIAKCASPYAFDCGSENLNALQSCEREIRPERETACSSFVRNCLPSWFINQTENDILSGPSDRDSALINTYDMICFLPITCSSGQATLLSVVGMITIGKDYVDPYYWNKRFQVSNGQFIRCGAVRISTKLVMTARHCVGSMIDGQRITVLSPIKGKVFFHMASHPSKSYPVTGYFATQTCVEDRSIRYFDTDDYCLLTVDTHGEPFPAPSQIREYKRELDGELEEMDIVVIGVNTFSSSFAARKWTSFLRFDDSDACRILEAGRRGSQTIVIRYGCNTLKGMSGSAIIGKTGSGPYILLGIHTGEERLSGTGDAGSIFANSGLVFIKGWAD